MKQLPSTYCIKDPGFEYIGEYVLELMTEFVDTETEAEYERTMAIATKGQRAAYACTWYLEEVRNGGHEQYFSNGAGTTWKDALAGLDLFEATDYKPHLLKAVECFVNASPSLDRETRTQQLEEMSEAAFEKMVECDQPVWDLGMALLEKMSDYVSDHEDEFFLPGA